MLRRIEGEKGLFKARVSKLRYGTYEQGESGGVIGYTKNKNAGWITKPFADIGKSRPPPHGIKPDRFSSILPWSTESISPASSRNHT